MRKISTLDENILITTNYPQRLKRFIDSEIDKICMLSAGPSPFSVRKILDYAKALSVHKTIKSGTVNVILN